MDNLDLKSLGLGQIKDTKNFLDLDLEELSNEVDGLESLAQQMESLTFTDMIDDGLILEKKRERNFRPKKGNGKRRKKQASKFSQMIQSGSSSSVTLCQLMNICDSVPMTSNVVEEKSMMMPFASSLRSELIVDAPDSLTSDTEVHEALVLAETGNSTERRQELEKAARMEDISFTEGLPAHREIDFSQGIPVTSHMVVSETRPGETPGTR